VLAEHIGNILDGRLEDNYEDVLILLASIVKHLPNAHSFVLFSDVMLAVLQKITRNRPKEYYSDVDVSEQKLSPEELVLRYQHTEKCLRYLRKWFGGTLELWMHQPFASYILDFRNSTTAFSGLQKELQVYDRKLADSVLFSLTKEQPPYTGVRLEHGLVKSGGVLLQ